MCCWCNKEFRKPSYKISETILHEIVDVKKLKDSINHSDSKEFEPIISGQGKHMKSTEQIKECY
jgi:hypothetical protein